MRTCEVPTCGEKHEARGMCKKHYQAKYRNENKELAKGLRKLFEERFPGRMKASYKKWAAENPEKIKGHRKKWKRSPHARFWRLRQGAEKRGIPVEISFEDYVELTSGSCHYCFGPLPEFGGGLDRLDNAAGYIKGNVGPCCTRCNKLKSNILTPDQMIAVATVLGWRKEAASSSPMICSRNPKEYP
jgi:hypothetical protein